MHSHQLSYIVILTYLDVGVNTGNNLLTGIQYSFANRELFLVDRLRICERFNMTLSCVLRWVT